MPSKDLQMFYKQALNFLEKGEYDKSIELLDMALNVDKKYKAAWNCKGVAYLEKKEYPKALESFEEVIQMDAGDNLAWYNKGYVLLTMGEFAEAKKVFNFFLARYENKNDDFYKYALYLLAKSYHGLKDYDNALISVDEAINKDNNFKEAIELKKIIQEDMNK